MVVKMSLELNSKTSRATFVTGQTDKEFYFPLGRFRRK